MKPEVKIKKLKPQAIIPDYARPGDVGLDLYSLEDCRIAPGKRKIFWLGFAMEFPDGYGALVMDKGGVAKDGVHTIGGVIDAGYRGEYALQLVNLGEQEYQVRVGQKIAQLVILPVAHAQISQVDELSDSERGEGRFGSTGKHLEKQPEK